MAESQQDFSTPLAAAKSYFLAVKTAEAQVLTNASVGTGYQKEWMVAYARTRIATGRVLEAATAKFGEEETLNAFGESVEFFLPVRDILFALTNCDVMIDGANATIHFRPGMRAGSQLAILYGVPAFADGLDTMNLQLVGKAWKVVLDPVIDKVETNPAWLKAFGTMMNQCATNTKAGIFKSAKEACQSCNQQVIETIMKQDESAPPGPARKAGEP